MYTRNTVDKAVCPDNFKIYSKLFLFNMKCVILLFLKECGEKYVELKYLNTSLQVNCSIKSKEDGNFFKFFSP